MIWDQMIFKDFETMAYVFLGVWLTAQVAEEQMTIMPHLRNLNLVVPEKIFQLQHMQQAVHKMLHYLFGRLQH